MDTTQWDRPYKGSKTRFTICGNSHLSSGVALLRAALLHQLVVTHLLTLVLREEPDAGDRAQDHPQALRDVLSNWGVLVWAASVRDRSI